MSEESRFPSYWAGTAIAGQELTAVVWECGDPAPGDPGGGNVAYIYEHCAGFGACTDGIQIHTAPAQLWPEGRIDLPGTEMVLGGVPVTRYQGYVEIYRPDVTIYISGGDGAQKAEVIRKMRPGPKVLVTLARHGLFFDPACLDTHYCQADRSIHSDSAELFVSMFAFWGIPFLIALVFGRPWLLLLPVFGWPLYFVGLEQGWWGYGLGDNGYFALIIAIPLGMADVAAGLALRKVLLGMSRRRTA